MASSLRISSHNSRQASVGNFSTHLGPTSSSNTPSSTSTAASTTSSNPRPVSEIFPPTHLQQNDDPMGVAARMWIDKLEEFEATLNEMAAAALDSDFKKELTAIEQWFRVLSEAERTAALYALLQQTTQVQITFFIQVLQQMGQQNPISSAAFSPAAAAAGEHESVSQQVAKGYSRLAFDGPATAGVLQQQHQHQQQQPSSPVGNSSGTVRRAPTVDSSTITSLFPDAAAVVANQKAARTQAAVSAGPGSHQGGSQPGLANVPASATLPSELPFRDGPLSPQPLRPNTSHSAASRPRSSLGLPVRSPQPPMSASPLIGSGFGLGSQQAHPQVIDAANTATISMNTPQTATFNPRSATMNPVSQRSGSWASMSNTPVGPTFQNLAGMHGSIQHTTLPHHGPAGAGYKPIALQAAPKGKFGSAGRPQSPAPHLLNSVLMGNQMLLNNSHLSELSLNAVANVMSQTHQPGSPAMVSPFDQFRSNGLISTLIQSPPPLTPLPSIQLHQPGAVPAPLLSPGMMSDSGELSYPKPRSPHGSGSSALGLGTVRRNVSKPVEDPTDPALLNDIPAWLRSLRLHKYTENLKDCLWEDMIEMDDAALEKCGVNALGARRKMLKAFEQVKEAKSAGKV